MKQKIFDNNHFKNILNTTLLISTVIEIPKIPFSLVAKGGGLFKLYGPPTSLLSWLHNRPPCY